jgi:hypothetical protein
VQPKHFSVSAAGSCQSAASYKCDEPATYYKLQLSWQHGAVHVLLTPSAVASSGLGRPELNHFRPKARLRQTISIIYGVLLIAIWLCVIGIVIAAFDSGSPKLLAAAGFIAAVALVEEFIEWRSRPRATKSALEQRSI